MGPVEDAVTAAGSALEIDEYFRVNFVCCVGFGVGVGLCFYPGRTGIG